MPCQCISQSCGLQPCVIVGIQTLTAMQADMLCKEELSGDNQYYCDYCGKKADATRQMCLQQLPPYLCLSLQRFVFDIKVSLQYCALLLMHMLQSAHLRSCLLLTFANMICALQSRLLWLRNRLDIHY